MDDASARGGWFQHGHCSVLSQSRRSRRAAKSKSGRHRTRLKAMTNKRHDGDAEHDAGIVARCRGLGNIGAEPVGSQRRRPPARRFRDDAGVPGAAARRDRAGHIIGEDSRKDDLPPPSPAANPEARRCFLEIVRKGARAGDDVEEDVPLGAENHERRKPDVRVEPKPDNRRDDKGEDDVGGEGSQELRQGLNPFGDTGPQSDPDPDRNPDEGRQRDQHNDTQERDQTEQQRMAELGPVEFRRHEVRDRPQRIGRGAQDNRHPGTIRPRTGRELAGPGQHGVRQREALSRQTRKQLADSLQERPEGAVFAG